MPVDTATVPPARTPRVWDRLALPTLHRLRDQVAGYRQRRFVKTQVFVTGSCGKSTTERLLGHILRGSGSVALVGHPNQSWAVLRRHRHQKAPVDFMVQEISASAPGELARPLAVLRADIGVITAVGSDHYSNYKVPGMSVLDAVAAEKGRLAAAVHAGGTVCLNADDERVAAMAERAVGRVVTFGTVPEADFRAVNVEAWPDLLRFDLVRGGRTYPVRTRFFGPLMLPNVLAALVAAEAAGVPLEAAIERVAEIEPMPQHTSLHTGTDGRTYVLDTFKAPLWSTEKFVESLAPLKGTGYSLVIADLSDVGGHDSSKYRRLIRRAAELADEVILTVTAAYYGRNLPAQGLANVVLAPTVEEVAAHLARSPHQLVILKSNASAKLARVVRPVGIDVPEDDIYG